MASLNTRTVLLGRFAVIGCLSDPASLELGLRFGLMVGAVLTIRNKDP